MRDAKQSDYAFVLATFLRGLYYGESWFSRIPKDIFMDNYKKVAQSMVNSPNVIIKIACLPEDPDVIIGYSMMSADYRTVHWVFVKSMWRNKGIARSIVPKHPETFTHLSKVGQTIWQTKFLNTNFNPFKPF